MKRIGFIGLGTMGKPMAANLLKKGHSVTVYNRTAGKADELVALGAESARTPALAARGADVVFTMLSNDAALLEVFHGENGIMAGLAPGQTVIDCSTVSPATSRRLYEELAGHYVDFLDAPVTGSKPAAEAATLVFMVGGNEDVFGDLFSLFMELGSKALYMGPSGSGSYTKLAHNAMVGINALALMEGLALATKAGLNPERFLEIVKAGSAYSRQVELKGPKILERDFSNQFSLKLMLKDLLLASDLTSQFQLPAPMLHGAATVFQMGLAKGYGEDDLSAVVHCYEEWIGRAIEKFTVSSSSPEPIPSGRDRRRAQRVHLDIQLLLSVYQWEQEGAFTGQNIEGTLRDLSENGLQIASKFPLAQDMFVVIHFPKEADLPPITGRIIRVETHPNEFRYGCLLSGLSPYVRVKLEQYIQSKI
ncbi:tartronate semialdehyde reductase [Gordoniibacillus kamchatkensis]|uniref:Tartronate semialdehyde reductase n=1 Tax=Gordoniibacillus kamchatkensis TaxID=1590651 RepID=A0ABR5AD40_9BACL|nr:tartronate semialdehyde reductase [Paenibacillus sp. VKM B-2647]